MTELTTDGYQSLREFAVSAHTAPNQWDYIGLYDQFEDEYARIQISSSNNLTWTDLDGDNIVTISGEITGGNENIPLGDTTVRYLAVHDSATGGRQISKRNQIAPFVFNQPGDIMNVTLNIEMPRLE